MAKKLDTPLPYPNTHLGINNPFLQERSVLDQEEEEVQE